MNLVRVNTSWHICFINRAGELMSDCGEIKAKRKLGVLQNYTGKRAEYVIAHSDSNFIRQHKLCETCAYRHKKWGNH